MFPKEFPVPISHTQFIIISDSDAGMGSRRQDISHGLVGTPYSVPRENKRHMLRDEITVIFKRRLFLFARQLGAINDTCSV